MQERLTERCGRQRRSLAVVVRRAETADAAAIAAIQVSGWHAAYRGIVPDDVLDRVTASDQTKRWFQRLEEGSETYFVEAGFCSVIRPARDASAPAELAAVYVDPARWRGGLGSALVTAALSSWRLTGTRGSMVVMPTISRFYGIVIAMYFDDHGFPHFHARHAGASAKVRFDQIEVIDSNLELRQLRLVLAWAELHRDELLENWRRARTGETLLEIEPLR